MTKMAPDELLAIIEERLGKAMSPPVTISNQNVVLVNASGKRISNLKLYDELNEAFGEPALDIPYNDVQRDSTAAILKQGRTPASLTFDWEGTPITKIFKGPTYPVGTNCKVLWIRDRGTDNNPTGNDIIVIMTTGADEGIR